MYRPNGLRMQTHSQARRIGSIRTSQRFVYNWAVELLQADPTLTWYDLKKEFTKLRRATPHLQAVARRYQDAAIHQARTAADISSKYGNGNLKFRSKKHDGGVAVVCDAPPRFVDNMHASLPGIGVIRLHDEQPYRYPRNWLHGARSFRIVDGHAEIVEARQAAGPHIPAVCHVQHARAGGHRYGRGRRHRSRHNKPYGGLQDRREHGIIRVP